MEPDLEPEHCYRAVLGRDARFDGRFFTAVRTTGVYCRPICPAPTPLRKNVRFFPSAAAAALAGFRPCLRCRPEAAPGSPAADGPLAATARALRLIAEGALDRMSTEALAAELGIGPRHLRRLFDTHVGASPIAVAQTRRLHQAKRLLDETKLPVSRIAFAAGFGSVRRFNTVFHDTFGRAPRALGRGAPGAEARDLPAMDLDLAYRPPLDWQALLAFLGERAIPGIEHVSGGVYSRSVRVDGTAGIIAIREAKGKKHALRLTLPTALAGSLLAIAHRVRRLFDLDADPRAIAVVLGRDPELAAAVKARPGLRVPGAWDRFEIAVRAILGQQVSVAAATTIAGRIAAAHGEALGESGTPGISHLFPAPERLLKAPLERLGLTRARADTVRHLAAAVVAETPVLRSGASLEAATAALEALPGIGPWTAHYVAMRALAEPDAFPAGDLGLQKALAPTGGDPPSAKELLARAETWRPWRAYAAIHLWTALAERDSQRRSR